MPVSIVVLSLSADLTHALIGILRDKSFKAMTDKEWDDVQQVHVKGAFAVTHACWPIFRKQKFGRIINVCISSYICSICADFCGTRLLQPP